MAKADSWSVTWLQNALIIRSSRIYLLCWLEPFPPCPETASRAARNLDAKNVFLCLPVSVCWIERRFSPVEKHGDSNTNSCDMQRY